MIESLIFSIQFSFFNMVYVRVFLNYAETIVPDDFIFDMGLPFWISLFQCFTPIQDGVHISGITTQTQFLKGI